MSSVKYKGSNYKGNNDTRKMDMIDSTRAFIVLHDTSLSSILFYIDCVIMPTGFEGPGSIWTNGVKIFLADEFFTWPRDQRCGAIIHEMCHIAYRHIQRCFQGCKFPKLMNYATDAIINTGMATEVAAGKSWNQLPGIPITLDKLIDHEDYYQTSPSDWNSHKVYIYLLKKAKQEYENRTGVSIGDGSGSMNELEQAVEDLLEKLADQFPSLPNDLQRDDETEPTMNNPMEDANWDMRIRRAIGTNPNSLLGRIGTDFEASTTPWYKILRREMKKHCMPQTRTTYTRPNRNMASLMVTTNSLKGMVFIPGYIPKEGLHNAVFILDSSGSCFDEEQQKTFAAEVQAIQQQTNVNIYLIYADVEIAAEYQIPNDGKSFKKRVLSGEVVAKGGGGTDMRVPIARAKELKSKLTVICTDGWTAFPEPRDIKGMKLIWCLNTDEDVPKHCGKVIRIPKPKYSGY